MIRQILLLLYCIVCLWIRGYSQSRLDPYFSFDVYTTKNGLSNNHITDIKQDSSGVLWISTFRGLTKYDGRKFTALELRIDSSNSLENESILALDIDSVGNIWIGSKQGLFKLDKNEHLIKVFPNDSIIIDNEEHIRDIYIDKNAILWFDTAAGFLYKYHVQKGILKKYKHNRPSQIHTYLYHSIYPDSSGKLWIGGRSMPVCYFSPENEEFTYFPIGKAGEKLKEFTDVMSYYESLGGEFYVGGVDGLYKLDTILKSFNRILNYSTQDIIQDKNKRTWILNEGTLKYWDEKDKTIIEIGKEGDRKNGFPSKYPTKLFLDNAGNIWIGTLDGLLKYAPVKNKVKKVFKIHETTNTLSSNKITAILETRSGKILVGSENRGLDVLDRNFIKTNNFNINSKKPFALESNSISTLFEDSYGNIYIGLWGGCGFQVMNSEMTSIKTFRLVEETRVYDWYSTFHETKNGLILIGTWGSYSLIFFDPIKGEFLNKEAHKPGFYSEFGSYFINSFLEDSSGNYWVGSTNRGLLKIDNIQDTLIVFHSEYTENSHYFGEEIHCIFEDQQKRIWVGGEGLFLFNNEKNQFVSHGKKYGLANQDIYSITQDESGNLWIGGSKGISRFHPDNNSFDQYDEEDGMPVNECTEAAAKLKDGKILIGTKEGLFYFHPNRIKKSSFLPKPKITEYKVFDEKYSLSERKRKNPSFRYLDNQFTFSFMSSDLSDPEHNLFRYKLVGLDKSWLFTKQGIQEVAYKHLLPGNYQFMVQTANPDGKWGTETATMYFKIKPPFWKTWWFITLQIIGALALVLYYIKSRENKMKERHKRELTEQRLLRAQMNPHFIFNALGAIQSYIFEKKPIEAGAYLSRFADLMRSILYSSKEELISLSLEIETLENYLKIQQLRFDDKFSYLIDIDETIRQDFTGVPPLLIQPLVENAIEHGFKNLKYRGHIDVRIELKRDKVLFEIKDNGQGIQKTHKESQKDPKHRSMALDILRDRLLSLNKHIKREEQLKYEDLENFDASSHGTKVSFFIPLISI